MDARELTKRMHEMENSVIEMGKEVDYLKQELEKQRLIISDLQVDVKMANGTRCRNEDIK